MADIRDLVEKWDGHTGNEVEKFLKQEIGKKQETLRLGAGLGWDEGKLAVRYGKGLTSDSQQGLRVDVGSLVSGGRGLNFYGDGTMGVSVGAGLKVASCEVVVDYGTGLKMSGNTLVLDKSVLPDVPAPEDIWSKSIDSTLEFGEGGDTLGVSLANIAGDGLEKSSGSQLQVLLGTEAPVRATCGGLGFTNAGGLALALGNKVFSLGPNGLGISTSETVTDAGGKLAVNYGRGLTSDSQQGLRVDVGSLVSGGRGLNVYGDGTMGVSVGAGLKIESCAVVVKYGTGLKMLGNTLVLDKSVLPDVPNPEDIWSKSIDSTLEFGEGGDTLGVSLANIAGDGLEKSSGSQLQVLLGTEAPVRATCGGLGFTNAGGLALALGNKVFKLGPAGLVISTSETITDAGGKLAVNYGKGLTSGSQQGLRVDVGSLVSGGRGLNFYGDGTMGVNVGRGLKIDSCAVVVDYGTGLKMSGNTLVLDKSVLPDVPAPEDIWSKSIDSTLEFGEGGDTLGVSLANIAGDGLEKSSGSQLQVVLGTEAPVRATCGGLGFTNAGGLALALGNKVFKLGPAGLGISTSETITDAGGKLAVRYGKGLTTNTCGGLIVDAANLTVGNATNATYLNGIHANYYTPRDRSVNGKDMNAQKESAIYMGYNMKNSAVTEISSFLLCRYSDDWGAQMQFSLVSGKVYVRFWQNAGGIMGTWKELAYKDGTVARATADANGNTITETYARRFMPTNGLEINSDRELFLPNLTSTLAGNAVDGSKNGAQRVLNLSCGAIQIKLSTGLAIDEEGYLYIQDKYVTK